MSLDSGNKAASYHLARQFEAREEVNIKFITNNNDNKILLLNEDLETFFFFLQNVRTEDYSMF